MQLVDKYTKFEKFSKKKARENPYAKRAKDKPSKKGSQTEKRNFLIEEKQDY